MSRESVLKKLVEIAEEEKEKVMRRVEFCCGSNGNRKPAEKDIEVHYNSIIVDLKRIDELGMTVNADLSTNQVYREDKFYREYSDHLIQHLEEMRRIPRLLEEGRFKPQFNV
jgi:hypothetical protein